MRVHRGTVAILCTGVALADIHLAQAQDATSTNLPSNSRLARRYRRQDGKGKRRTPSLKIAAKASSQKPTPVAEQTTHPPEEPVTAAIPVQKKTGEKKQTAPAAQPKGPTSSTPTPLSLPGAQAIAVSAPLPEYPYQAKRANITGSGVCVMTIDTASGKVTDVTMTQSTSDAIFDKVTANTFRKWRFKPGTVSQVGVPIDYE